MILTTIILIPAVAGLLAWPLARASETAARWLALLANIATLVIGISIWLTELGSLDMGTAGEWIVGERWQWIPRFGINFHLAVDGLSLLMVLLTSFLGAVSVIISWNEITERVGFFHFNLLWILAGINGVFMSMDLFLFYFFWEIMLVPMYFLIAIWGHERRIYAATKFFLFTQLSGLFMLISILGLYFYNHAVTGHYTFNYMELRSLTIPIDVARWLMLGFLIAFAVKLPAVPFHTWLADAHTEAPTAGSVILAGLLLKTGAYGLIRFVLPLFPDAAHEIAPLAMTIGVIGILYGALLAFGQTDLKRLVAYTSVSHLGFVLLGVFAFTELSMQGAIMEMICHGLSTGGLFILVGALQQKTHTRDMNEMGGLWGQIPRMGGLAMFFALASLGLPGLGNFVGEFLVLIGSFDVATWLTVLAAVGLVAATIYSLWIMQRVFHGEKRKDYKITDLPLHHTVVLGAMIIVLVWLGLYPRPILNTSRPTVTKVQEMMKSQQTTELESSTHAFEGQRR